jgi:signal transduction histidine kinase
MSTNRITTFLEMRSNLLRTLHFILWFVPALMSLVGLGYTYLEHRRHIGEPGWPYPTYLATLVLGVIGPMMAWFVLRWARQTTIVYLISQELLAHRAEELTRLNKLSIAASHTLELNKTISTILEECMEALDAAAGMVFIQRDDNPGLRLEAHRGISVEMAEQESHLKPGHCLCGQAVTKREVLFAGQVEDDPRCSSNLCICEGFRSVACAPLITKGQLVGLLQLASPNPNHFTQDQRWFLAAAAAQASVSIENARLYEKVRQFNLELEEMVSQRTKELESAQKALAEKAHQLQRLLSESYRIQEDTQERIAHDMHDGVTQTLIGALYETQAAQESLADNPEKAALNLARAQQLLTEVETEIRRVIYDLHPPILDMMGLVIALKRFASTYSLTFQIDCQVQVKDQPKRLSKATEITIYRIIQAALHNVATHSFATQTKVLFEFAPNALTVTVEDNGVGFDPRKALETPGDHLGLIGMKERAESLGAQLEVISSPGNGTQIKLILPQPDYQET